MKIRIVITSLTLGLTSLSLPALASGEEGNSRAPIIVQPRVNTDVQTQTDGGFFSGLGRIFRPREEQQRNRPGMERGQQPTTRRQGESREEFANRYMAERAERLRQRTISDPSAVMTRENNPYNVMMPKSHNPLTHYQGRDGKIHKRDAPIDKDVLTRVHASIQRYAAERNTTVEALMQNPQFERRVEALYTKTLRETREAEQRAAAEAKARAEAEAKRRAEEQRRQQREAREREREERRQERDQR